MAEMKEVRVRVKKITLVMVKDNADLVDHDDHLRLDIVRDRGLIWWTNHEFETSTSFFVDSSSHELYPIYHKDAY